MSLWRTRSLLYRLARLLGDIQAARRGPAALARRILRRLVWREASRSLRRGLW